MTLDSARSFVATLQSRTTRYEGHPINHVREGGLSPYTVHCYVRILKTFSAWLNDEGFTKVNVFSKLKRPKLPTPVIQVLSEEEIANVFERINPNCPLGGKAVPDRPLALRYGYQGQRALHPNPGQYLCYRRVLQSFG